MAPEDPKTLKECMAALSEPFIPGKTELYRVGPSWPKPKATHCQPLAYVSAQTVRERLDRVVGPDGWETRMEVIDASHVLCHMTVLGVTRADAGAAGDGATDKLKSAASDALKRAAANFGVGAYLKAVNDELAPVRCELDKRDKAVLPKGFVPPERRAAAAAASARSTPASSPAAAKPTTPPPGPTVPPSPPASQELVDEIGAQVTRLGWMGETASKWLWDRVRKSTRHELTMQEGVQVLEELKRMPTPAAAAGGGR